MEFVAHALDGVIVNQLLKTDNMLYAATNEGLYALQSTGEWQLQSPADWDIQSLAAITAEHLIVAATYRGQPVLAETLDVGGNWDFLQHDFGGSPRATEPVNRLLWDASEQVMFAVGIDVLAQSLDYGRSWTAISGQWNSFARGMRAIAYHPSNDFAFYGGQGAIENPVLRRVGVSDLSETSMDVSDLLPFPSSIRAIQYDNFDPQKVYAAGEGGIIASDDLGDSWRSMLAHPDFRFYFEILQHPTDQDTFYTAGWEKNFDSPQHLIVEITEDAGQTWQAFQHENDDLFGGMRAMILERDESGILLYIGLYGGGVVTARVTH